MPPTTRQTELKHLRLAALRRLAASGLHHHETRQVQHRRARERCHGAGLIRTWAWVPENMAESIRALMAGLVAQLDAGHPPRLTLIDAREQKAGERSDAPGADCPALPAAEDAGAGRAGGDSERSCGTPLARKRMRNRRAVARKKAAGLKRVALTIPHVHERVLRAQLHTILYHLRAGRVVSLAPAQSVQTTAPDPHDHETPAVTVATLHGTGCALFDDIHALEPVPDQGRPADVRSSGSHREGSRPPA